LENIEFGVNWLYNHDEHFFEMIVFLSKNFTRKEITEVNDTRIEISDCTELFHDHFYYEYIKHNFQTLTLKIKGVNLEVIKNYLHYYVFYLNRLYGYIKKIDDYDIDLSILRTYSVDGFIDVYYFPLIINYEINIKNITEYIEIETSVLNALSIFENNPNYLNAYRLLESLMPFSYRKQILELSQDERFNTCPLNNLINNFRFSERDQIYNIINDVYQLLAFKDNYENANKMADDIYKYRNHYVHGKNHNMIELFSMYYENSNQSQCLYEIAMRYIDKFRILGITIKELIEVEYAIQL
jgi:hypothetical protein